MRLLILILIFIGSMAPAAVAQIIPAVTAGPKVGMNSSILYTDIEDYREDETLGYHAGIFIRFGNRSRIYIQPEAYYDIKGGKFEYTIDQNDPYTPSLKTTEEALLTIRLETLNFPLLLGLKVLDLYGFNIRLVAGPMATYILSEDAKLTASGEDYSDLLPSQRLLTDAIWSIQAGGGMDILMFSIDFRYEFGMNDISNIPTAKTKTYLYNLSIGVKLF